jgi:hypothetical protein
MDLRRVAKVSMAQESGPRIRLKNPARNIIRAVARRKTDEAKTFPHDSFQVIHHVNVQFLIPIDSGSD